MMMIFYDLIGSCVCSHYEDDFEADEDEIDEEIARLSNTEPPARNATPRLHPATDDDIYDFSNTNIGGFWSEILYGE